MVRPVTARLFIAMFLIVGLVPHAPASSRAYVTPHAVFLDDDNRSAQVIIGASGDGPEEVTIDVQFGFPDVDPSGMPFLRLMEDPGPGFPSAAAWVRPFPRRVRLEPGQQQIVRLLAVPPDTLPDGEYWTRLILTSRGLSTRLASPDSSVRAGLDIVLRLITSVTFRKGEVQTGLVLDGLEVDGYADSMVAWVTARPEGNGGYLGTATFELVDGDGSVVQAWPVPIAVYYPFRRHFLLRLDEAAQGDYELRLTVETRRDDLEEGEVLLAPTVRSSAAVRVP